MQQFEPEWHAHQDDTPMQHVGVLCEDRAVGIVSRLVTEGKRRVQHLLVRLACAGLETERIWPRGYRFVCIWCGESFIQDEHCRWGYCRRCS